MTSIFDNFKLRAEAVSAEVHRFPHKTAALTFIVQYLQEAGVADSPQSYAVWADCPFLRGVNQERLTKQVPGLSFAVTRERAAASKVGISQLDWAMANTGSLIQDAAPVDRRLVSTLPSIHIAIVETNRLLPDMPAVFSKIRPEQTNYISFITGPSRTADIERVLTIGVHGPEKLIIVFVDDMAGVN
ncbi:MAG: lactate utilization protein [Candidatus Korobacteraceae bacterium]|jgi:L-lactate dehydrogenase complex protein LldG